MIVVKTTTTPPTPSSWAARPRRRLHHLHGLAATLILSLGVIATVAQPAAASSNRCSNMDLTSFFLPGTADLDMEGVPVRTIGDDVAVREAPDEAAPIVMQLEFGKRFRMRDFSDDSEGWGELVSDIDSRTLGWARLEDLLCGMTPLIEQNSGLERKAIIRTATSLRSDAEGMRVWAYRQPEDGHCTAQDCLSLSRFDPHFIFDESEDRYLIARSYNLTSRVAMPTGWVSKDEIIAWNTAAGLRPREGLTYQDQGAEADGQIQEGRVCAYATIEEAREQPVERCRPILGGPRWYRSPMRLPVIGVEDDFYRIVVVGAGYGAGTFTNDPVDPNFLRSADLSAANSFRRIDVFFVIDGTESMENVISAIRGTPSRPGIVATIQQALGEGLSQGMSYRYGFRIFRDSVPAAGGQAARTGVEEGLPLSGNHCDAPTRERLEQNHRAFDEAFAQVQASPVPTPPGVLEDYAENTLGGLDQALIDIAGCSKNLKVIFVIGDNGYNADKQRSRGFVPVTADRIANALTDGRFNSPPLLYFIQTPRELSGKSPRQRDDYNRAYEWFHDQAMEILKEHERRLTESRTEAPPGGYNLTDHFVRLGESDMTEEVLQRITETVRNWTNPGAVNELLLDLRGGASLVDAIERLRANDMNVPILFWDMVEDRLCTELGEQCRERVYEGVLEAYVERSDDVVSELWMTREQLDSWLTFLHGVRGMGWSPSELREKLVKTLVNSLESLLHTRYSDVREPLETFVRRAGGLPMGFGSPVMQYSQMELENPQVVPTCEVELLASWLQDSKKILEIARQGIYRPDFVNDFYPPDACPLTPKGRQVPYIPGSIRPVPLGETPEYSYHTQFQAGGFQATDANTRDSRVVYWLPQEFLP